MPETVSSMWPFSAPRAFCCALKSLRVRREIVEVSAKTSGTGTRLATAMIGLRAIMMARVPATTTTPDMSCTADWETVTLTASTSLVSRLMRSPCGRVSKNESGRRCILPKNPSRTLRTMRCETPAMIQPSRACRTAPPR